MDLRSVDLNLLMPLQALLDEKSVSRAAERMHMSQPAASSALARLRRHFGDDLLVRRGNTYELSPLAVNLRERSWAAISSLERVFSSQAEFDPETTTREFTIRGSDYSFAILGRELSAIVSERAPKARIRFAESDAAVVDAAPESLRDCDGIIIPHGFLRMDTHLNLFTDRWMCLVDENNERVGDTLTVENLSDLPWVFTYMTATSFTPAARQMQMIGIEPRIEAVTTSFLALAEFIEGTDRIGLIQERLGRRLVRGTTLQLRECPFDVVPLKEAFWWNEIYAHDPEHIWLREIMAEASQRVIETT